MNQEHLSQILIQQQQLLLDEMKNDLLVKKVGSDISVDMKKGKKRGNYNPQSPNPQFNYNQYMYPLPIQTQQQYFPYSPQFPNGNNPLRNQDIFSDQLNLNNNKPILENNPFERLSEIGMMVPPSSAPSGISRTFFFFFFFFVYLIFCFFYKKSLLFISLF
jgi:hypothetical protein